MRQTIEVSASCLADIAAEAGQNYFGTASSLGPLFVGGFDHIETAVNGWSCTLHDRGMNDRWRDTTYRVPVDQRDARKGPLA
jgi:hypothetical protein